MTRTPASLAALEDRIAERFRRRHCVLTGSGTAALYCIFASLSRSSGGRRVLYPEITCETAVNASIFAGLEPVFLDVDAADGTLSPEAGPVADAGDAVAVVPTHIYGHLMDLERLDAVLPRATPRVEDAAQAYGGALRGRPAGGMGDAAIISFGEGKLVDCGSGGAVLTDDTGLAESCREESARLPEGRDAGETARAAVMREMMEARRAWRVHRDRSKLLAEQRQILMRHRNGYLWRATEADAGRIGGSLGGMDDEAERRRRLAGELDRLLDDADHAARIARRGDVALWRYAFTVEPALRDQVQRDLREAGVRATKLFAPCSEKFAADPPDTSAARAFSSRILNLDWPDRAGERAFLETVGQVLERTATRSPA